MPTQTSSNHEASIFNKENLKIEHAPSSMVNSEPQTFAAQTSFMIQAASLSEMKRKAMESGNYEKHFEQGGLFYEGQLIDGVKSGYGCQVKENGEKYEGQWVDGRKEGFGKLTFSNGEVYTGMFLNDKPNGQGKKEFILGKEVYDGMWENGKANGQGVYYYGDGVTVYRGEFWDMKP